MIALRVAHYLLWFGEQQQQKAAYINKRRGSVWEINNASRTERLAELMTTNTNVDELVEDNKYLIVDKLRVILK